MFCPSIFGADAIGIGNPTFAKAPLFAGSLCTCRVEFALFITSANGYPALIALYLVFNIPEFTPATAVFILYARRVEPMTGTDTAAMTSAIAMVTHSSSRVKPEQDLQLVTFLNRVVEVFAIATLCRVSKWECIHHSHAGQRLTIELKSVQDDSNTEAACYPLKKHDLIARDQ